MENITNPFASKEKPDQSTKNTSAPVQFQPKEQISNDDIVVTPVVEEPTVEKPKEKQWVGGHRLAQGDEGEQMTRDPNLDTNK